MGAGGCVFGGRYVPVCTQPVSLWWTVDQAEGERKEPDREQGRELDEGDLENGG